MDDDGLARPLDGHVGRPTHNHLAHHTQQGRQALARAVRVGRAQGVAVHGAAAKNGQGVGREDGFGRHPAQGVVGRHLIGFFNRLDMAQQQRARFVGRQHVEEFRHGRFS